MCGWCLACSISWLKYCKLWCLVSWALLTKVGRQQGPETLQSAPSAGSTGSLEPGAASTVLGRMLLKSWDSKVWGRGGTRLLGSSRLSCPQCTEGRRGGEANKLPGLPNENQCGGVDVEPHCPGTRAESAEAGRGLAALGPKLSEHGL